MITPLWRNRDFVLLWSGQAVSSIGTGLATVAYPLLVLAVTGSAAAAGIIGCAGALALVAGSLPAGLWADRHPVRALIIGCQVTRALVAASVVGAIVWRHLTVVHLLIATITTQFCAPTVFAAETIAVRHVVPPPQLAGALAQNEARGHLADLTGRPAGGYLYAIGAALPILADAISFLACAVAVAGVRGSLNARRAPTPSTPVRTRITTGLQHIWRSPFLRTTLLCSAGINIAFAGLTLAVIASQRGQGSAHLGLALGLGSIGGLVGAAVSTPVLRRIHPATVVIGFGWIVAVLMLLLGQAHNVYAVGALLALVQFVTAPANGVLFAAQIHITPPHLQGRVISAAVTLLGLSTPLGPLAAGILVEHAGQSAAFSTFAAIVAASTTVMHRSRDVRGMPDLRQPAQAETAPDSPPIASTNVRG